MKRTAVVTGAASGIGLEFCRQLAAKGYSLLLIDRNPLDDAIKLLNAGPHFGLQVDLTDNDATEKIERELDRLDMTPDLLINNAGIFDFASVTSMPVKRLDLYIDLHIRSVTRLSRLIGMRMIRRHKRGRILNMSSMSCWMPMGGIAMYSATKAYIRAFSRALRLELHDAGVSVTVACPGGIATDLFGLPRRLQRVGVAIGALATPQAFVRGALRAADRRCKQYVNGLLNRIAIAAVGSLPDCLRLIIKRQTLDRLNPDPICTKPTKQ